MENEFYDAQQTADYLHITKNYVYILARMGIIPSIRPLPGKVLFYREDLKNFLLQHRVASDEEELAKYENEHKTHGIEASPQFKDKPQTSVTSSLT